MYSKFLLLLILVSYILISACKTEKVKTEIELSSFNKVLLLDSMAASKIIIKDDVEHFFDNIKPIDMVIQMQRNYNTNIDSIPQSTILEDYKKFVQADIADFTKSEADFIVKTMAEAFELCNKAQLQYFPEEIKLIKTKGKHYGDDTYYTRENLIIIPQQALKKRAAEEFLKVILHEISHIITRNNPSVKAQLYTLIGFTKLDKPLIINDSLQRRVLLNPDGSDLGWSTQLVAADGKNVSCIPIIYANETGLVAEKNKFFQYLGFNYFEIQPSTDGKSYVVQTIGEEQKSTLNTEGINEEFLKKYNTDYIIHPDEIVADNFSILMYSMKSKSSLKDKTEGGQLLIQKIKEVLSKK